MEIEDRRNRGVGRELTGQDDHLALEGTEGRGIGDEFGHGQLLR